MKTLLGAVVVMVSLGVVWASAASPYYYGSYGSSDTGSDNSAQPAPPSQPTAEPEPQPPVVYQPVPVYQRPFYRAPAWAMPNAAALGPWPWNFDFGGGPTTMTGSNNLLNGGSNFEFGGGYNFSPRAGWVLEFMNHSLGVTNNALQQNNAISGDAGVLSVTLNPIWRFRIAGPVGGYLIGGGGYYQREMRFDEPVQVFIPTFSGGFYTPGIETVHQYDDTGGVNIGAGLTWNAGWGTKLFVEARYHYIFTSGTATQIIPVTFGLRW
jgi:hypothetical protein